MIIFLVVCSLCAVAVYLLSYLCTFSKRCSTFLLFRLLSLWNEMNNPVLKTPRKRQSHFQLGKFYAFKLRKPLSSNVAIPFPKTLKVRLVKFIWFFWNQNWFISHKGPLLRVPNVVVIELNSMHHAWMQSDVSLNKE